MKALDIFKDFSKSSWVVQQATAIIKLMTRIEHTRSELRKLIGVELENEFWNNTVYEAERQPTTNNDFILAKYKTEITKLQYEQI